MFADCVGCSLLWRPSAVRRRRTFQYQHSTHPHSFLPPTSPSPSGTFPWPQVYRILGKDEVARGYQPRPWDGLDCTGTGLRVLGPPLFRMTHLTHLYLSGNALEFVPPAIRRLPLLQTLDLSNNDIQVLPGEVGRLKQLRELLLYNNAIASLPFELGKAFRLAVLGLHGNPLAEPLLSYAKEGTGAVINYLLDSSPSASIACWYHLGSPAPGIPLILAWMLFLDIWSTLFSLASLPIPLPLLLFYFLFHSPLHIVPHSSCPFTPRAAVDPARECGLSRPRPERWCVRHCCSIPNLEAARFKRTLIHTPS